MLKNKPFRMTDLEYRVLKYIDDHPKTNGHPEFEIVKGVGMDPCKNYTGFFTKLYNRRWLSEDFSHSPRYHLTAFGSDLLKIETNRRKVKCPTKSTQI